MRIEFPLLRKLSRGIFHRQRGWQIGEHWIRNGRVFAVVSDRFTLLFGLVEIMTTREEIWTGQERAEVRYSRIIDSYQAPEGFDLEAAKIRYKDEV